jgi:prepilin-type N-terminal cleavage/methylation domain-containing protein
MSPDGTLNLRSRRPGFTLIELLVVIFIIGLLVALTLTIVPKVKRAVYGAQTQAQLSALSNAIQQYYNDYKSYPGPLPDSQLVTIYDSATAPYVIDPTTLKAVALVGTNGNSGSNTMASTADASSIDTTKITGAQNLVLGLLGGLRTDPGTPITFEYHPEDLFSFDGITPVPHGPASLNVAAPKRQQAYIQIKSGDISVPNKNINSGQFTDSANRGAGDSMIPVFLDKYSDPLPILYYRTNIGGAAIVGLRKTTASGVKYTDDSGAALTTTGGQAVIPQYNLVQNIPYVTSRIGTTGSLLTNPNSYHGLQGLGTSTDLSDPIDATVSSSFVPSHSGKNGVAYFKDPTLNPPYNSSTSPQITNTYQGVARQKDGYILISAGPDRLYGTRDDNVFPGPLVP